MVFLEKIFGKRSSSVDNGLGYEKTELEKLLLRRIVELRVDEAVVVENVLPSKSLDQEIKDAYSRDKDRGPDAFVYDAYDKYPYLMALYDLSKGLRYNTKYKETMSREDGTALCAKYIGRRLRDYLKDEAVQSKIKVVLKELAKKRKAYLKEKDFSPETLRKMDKYMSAYQEFLVKK
ncbi:hypothetical protein [Ruminobacter amylophilus]|uniref:hypothetical protein n=1 Tax=Ruminobacter amylophilus TaxID=867 RepID=UPI00386D9C12